MSRTLSSLQNFVQNSVQVAKLCPGRKTLSRSQNSVEKKGSSHAAIAKSRVYMCAMLLKPRMSPPRSRLPASQFRGESAAGSDSSASTAWHTDWGGAGAGDDVSNRDPTPDIFVLPFTSLHPFTCSVHAGLHAFFKMSRQISPVCRAWYRRNTVKSRASTQPNGCLAAEPYLEVDVGVENSCPKAERGGNEGILLRHLDVQHKSAPFVRSLFGTLQKTDENVRGVTLICCLE